MQINEIIKQVPLKDWIEEGYSLPNQVMVEGKRDSSNWEEPIPFWRQELPSFPTEIFPHWLRNYIEGVSETTQTPVDAAAMFALSILSTALAKKFYVSPRLHWEESINLYTVVVLPPGEKKSVIYKLLSLPVTLYEKEERERLEVEMRRKKAELKAKKKRKEELENQYAKKANTKILEEIISLEKELLEGEGVSLPRFIADDITPEKVISLLSQNQEKLAILSSEGGIFDIIAGRYSQHGKANFEVFLKAYSGDYCAVDRMGRTEVVEEPILTLGLFVQPSVLQGIPEQFSKRGLLGRFLYSLPKSNIGKRNVEPKLLDTFIENTYHSNVRGLLSLKMNSSIKLILSKEAYPVFIKFCKSIENRMGDGKDLSQEAIRAWANKSLGHLLRVMGLLHVAHWVDYRQNKNIQSVPQEIPKEIVERVIVASNYFIEHTKAAFDCVQVNEETSNAEYLLKVIIRQDKFILDYRDIWLLTKKRFNKAANLKKYLLFLEEHFYVKEAKEGRKTVYEINPHILSGAKSSPDTLIRPEILEYKEKNNKKIIPSKKFQDPQDKYTNDKSYAGGGEGEIEIKDLSEQLENVDDLSKVGEIGERAAKSKKEERWLDI